MATKRGATVKFNMERLAVRYFKDGGSLQYDFEMPGHVYYNQIFGTIRSISRRRFEGLPVSLVSFRISDDECQRARQLVSVAGPPPITQEFDEFEDDDDTPTHGGDDDDALAQYEAAPSRPKSKAKRLQEEQHEGEGEGIPSSSVAAAVKPRPPPRDWSARCRYRGDARGQAPQVTPPHVLIIRNQWVWDEPGQ